MNEQMMFVLQCTTVRAGDWTTFCVYVPDNTCSSCYIWKWRHTVKLADATRGCISFDELMFIGINLATVITPFSSTYDWVELLGLWIRLTLLLLISSCLLLAVFQCIVRYVELFSSLCRPPQG